MAGGAGRAWNRRAKTISRNGTLADRDFFSALPHLARWPQTEALLRDGIGRDRDRISGRGHPSGGPCLTHPYAKPDGISEQTVAPAGARKTVSAPRGGASCGKRGGARHPAQAAGRDQLIYRRLKTETNSGAHHAKVIAISVHDIPAKIVDHANVRRESKFEAGAKLPHALGIAVAPKAAAAVNEILEARTVEND